jgi:hypothetical protein
LCRRNVCCRGVKKASATDEVRDRKQKAAP